MESSGHLSPSAQKSNREARTNGWPWAISSLLSYRKNRYCFAKCLIAQRGDCGTLRFPLWLRAYTASHAVCSPISIRTKGLKLRLHRVLQGLCDLSIGFRENRTRMDIMLPNRIQMRNISPASFVVGPVPQKDLRSRATTFT